MSFTKVTSTHIAIFLPYSFATICLSLRILSRRLNHHIFWLDDYFAIAAWVFATAWNTVLMIWIAHGFGQHIDQLPEPESTVLFYSRLLNWNLDLFYAFSLGSSKLSLLALYWRLFSITNIRQPIRLLAVCAVIWIIVRTFLTIFMCVPTQGIWDKSIPSTCNVDQQEFFFGSTLTHLIIDVAILCLPIWQISQLRLDILPKAGLCITFAFGTLVCVASIIVLAPAFHFNGRSDDVTWNNVSMFIWATVEVNLAIVAVILLMIAPGSFPMMRGVVTHLFKRHTARSQVCYTNSAISTHKSALWPSYKIFATTVNSSHSDDESIMKLANIPKRSDQGP